VRDITIKFRKITNTAKPLIKSSLLRFSRIPMVDRILRNWQGPCAIFCLHRVLPDEQVVSDQSPNSNLSLSVSRFSEMLEFLRERYRVVSLARLVDHLKNGSKEFVICLTFDDGYRDNMDHALPILEQFNCPATLYITTRFPEGDGWMWWYELWEQLQSMERLELEFEGLTRIWDLSNQSQINRCYFDLSSWMMMLPLESQKKLLKVVTGTEERHLHTNICLNWDDIIKLDRHPLITIGAHTHSHPNLTQETETTAREEILNSKILLERRLGHTVDHFAYPFGTSKEVGVRELRLVKECGFQTAVTTSCHKARWPNCLMLPRYGTNEDNSTEVLKTRISGVCNLMKMQLA